jgi:hypothetical protein
MATNLNSIISSIYFGGANKTFGEVYGIEFELECENYLPNQTRLDADNVNLVRIKDDSLRGHSGEFISNFPQTKEELLKTCTNFYKTLKGFKSKVIEDSPRTSTHIHINFADKSFKQVLNFCLLFYCVEEILLSFAGPKRINNQFCLPLKECEGQNYLIECLISNQNNPSLSNQQNYKYSNLNITALTRHGSLEVRSLPGYPSLETLETWLNMLSNIYRVSTKRDFNPYKAIVENLSQMGPREWLKFTLPEIANVCSMVPEKELNNSIYSNFRLIQQHIVTVNNLLKKEKQN